MFSQKAQPRGVQVFLSYAHTDKIWFDHDGKELVPRIKRHIERHGGTLWLDEARLRGGSPFREEIERAIQQSYMAILLVSYDFLTSDFIRTVELPLIEKRVNQEKLFRVLCIRVDDTANEEIPFQSRFLHLPKAEKPLSAYLDDTFQFSTMRNQILESVGVQRSMK